MEHLYAGCSLMQCLEEADGEWEDAFALQRKSAVRAEETFVLLISSSSGLGLVMVYFTVMQIMCY